jgi:Na+-transporting methylmalonyl-CoA/oxaloacetate decarboxylase gamma subunit
VRAKPGTAAAAAEDSDDEDSRVNTPSGSRFNTVNMLLNKALRESKEKKKREEEAMKRKIQKQGEQIRRLQLQLSQRLAGEQASGPEGSLLLSSLFLYVLGCVFFLLIFYFFFFLCISPCAGPTTDRDSFDAEAHPTPMPAPAAAPVPDNHRRDLPVLRTANTDRKQRGEKKRPDATETMEKEQRLLRTIQEKEAKAIGKLRKLLGTLMRSNTASSTAIQAGEYLHFLADLEVDDNDDDSDDDDYDPSSDENSDDEAAPVAADRPKRHADSEPIGLDRPQFFRGGAANDNINHLKSPVPYSKLRDGKAVEAPVGLDDSLYEDVPESEYVPLLDRILAEAWDEKSIAFLMNLLSLLDSSVSAAFKEAVVLSLCSCVFNLLSCVASFVYIPFSFSSCFFDA